MKVLVVKTSSLGDVIHTLPALTDAAAAIPGVRFDWVVEEAFAEVPAWHPAVERVIPVALRRWRRGLWRSWRAGEWQRFRNDLRASVYDAVIDAQGLVKSAALALQARGPRHGLDRASAREPLAALAYQHRLAVPRELHAVERVRRLFAQALGYALPETAPDFGIGNMLAAPLSPRERAGERGEQRKSAVTPSLIFLHGTTWPSKHWPLAYWQQLIDLANAQGYEVLLPWGSEAERERAENLAAHSANAWVLPRLGLTELAREFRQAAGVVGLDSGLSHLAAALGTPGVSLYGPTRTDLTGVVGPRHRNLVADFPCAPCLRRYCNYRGEAAAQPGCFAALTPERVWAALCRQMQGDGP